MPDDRTARIAALAAELERLDPPHVRTARRMYLAARADLAGLMHRGAAQDVLEAHRYRLERSRDVLDLALQRGLALY